MTTRGLGPRPARIIVSGIAAAAVTAAGVAGSVNTPALAAPGECVTAYPTDSLVDGQALTGLTVSRGTTPEPFTGSYLGTLQDGIAPGVDMILAELHSTAIDANGVWQGMSGSPVYVDDQLVGAVSYTLTEGKTSLAGITPSESLLALIPGGPAPAVALPRAVAKGLVAEGEATAKEAASGLRPIRLPMSVSGLTPSRFDQLAGWLDDNGPVTRGVTGTTAGTAAPEIPIQDGGNVAASLGWGFVSAAAVGTATEVCGGDVVAFGHPFNYSGDVTYSLHGADAVAIVPGTTFSGYKLANLGAPMGTVDQDRLAGLHGVLGALPAGSDVSASATYRGRTVDGTTHVTVGDLVTDAGLANTFAVNDRALDHTGKGSALASWTIRGTRRDGSAFSLSHSDRYVDDFDVASAPVSELAMQLYTLLENPTEAVTITSIDADTTFADDATRYRVGRAYWRTGGTWKRITNASPAVVRPGRTSPVRVELYSRSADTRFATVRVTPAKASAGRVGSLRVTGGFSGGDDFEFFDSEEEFVDAYEDELSGGHATIPEAIKALRADQANDTLRTRFAVRGTRAKVTTIDLDQVVSGSVEVPIFVRR